MITPNMKISIMLRQYPETLEVLLNTSPHFSKLKNEFLRKTLGSKVNVEQAAKIAGVSLPELIIELNKTINKNITEDEVKDLPMSTAPVKENDIDLNKIPSEKIVDLDVRDDIKNGKDPIHRIKPAIDSLKDDEFLHIINSFEPVPLYTVLGSRGFAHYTEKQDDVFHVYFFNEKKSPVSQTPAASVEPDAPGGNDLIEIDVRELTPPEPMMKILSILPKMSGSSILLVHHHREPMMLYDKLNEMGFQAVTQKINDNYYKVVITKK